jgi:hypothetical protein
MPGEIRFGTPGLLKREKIISRLQKMRAASAWTSGLPIDMQQAVVLQ